VPALGGAPVVAAVGVTSTSAVSVRPWSSLTVTRTVKLPAAGATTTAESGVGLPAMTPAPAAIDQSNAASVRLQAAALPAVERSTFCPGLTLAGVIIAAIGRCAAATAAAAFAMPAPHVDVVQLHSNPCTSPGPAGTWHIGTVGSLDTGNGVVAPSMRRARICAGLRLPLTEDMRPAIAATIGAEKLVPTLRLIWSV
jgi:hypothetical protein